MKDIRTGVTDVDIIGHLSIDRSAKPIAVDTAAVRSKLQVELGLDDIDAPTALARKFKP